MLGFNEDSYGQYERGIVKLTNANTIEKIIKILDIEDKIKLPEYISFLKENPKEQVKKYMVVNNSLCFKEFACISQISERTVRGWFGKDDKQISRKSYERLKESILS